LVGFFLIVISEREKCALSSGVTCIFASPLGGAEKICPHMWTVGTKVSNFSQFPAELFANKSIIYLFSITKN
jgi:hypothetical protein